MKKSRILALLLAACMVFSLLPFTAFADEATDKIVAHVDANARFAGDGSAEKPFKTIENAKEYLRTKDHRKKSAEVIIHAGVYPQELALTFTHEDSGSEKYPVIYRAAGDGEVRISSAVTLNHMEFEPIRDKEILSRIPAEAQDKVGVLSLEGYNLDMSMFDVFGRATNPQQGPMFPYLHLNGKMQEVAKWPNVGLQTIGTVVKTGELQSSGTKGEKGEWKYDNLRPERWTKADQAIIRGYLGSEYAMDFVPFGGVNLENKSIYLNSKSIYGVKPGHRWYIQNLLEEIDSPGEFFVDYKTEKLYWYPPYKLKPTDSVEISTYNKNYIKFEGASYIILDGINIDSNVSNYGVHISNSSNITIKNATMHNLHRAIYLNGTSRNNLVEACTFYDTNTTSVVLYGGADLTNWIPSNNRVANCHFYRWGLGTWMQSKVAVDIGRGGHNTLQDVVEHCVMHGQPNGQGMVFGSVESQIRYNEMHSLTNDSADMGVIYCGRNLGEPGNVISYNYLHDFGPIFEARYQLQGIYWDDWQSGQIAHHNIIVPGSKSRTAGNLFVGADSYYCENIVVNSDIGVRATDRGTTIHDTAYKSAAAAYVTPAVLERYPAIAGYRPQLEKDNMLLLCKGNVFENNLSVDVNRNNFHKVHVENGSFKNNQISDDYSVFVDSANHDYRLKREAVKEFGFPETFLSEDNFDMNMIGIQEEVMKIEKPSTPFRLLYPTNGQMDVIRNTAYIKWEAARFADIYEYIVATDPELTQVVASGKSLYNVVELPDLKNDTVYYYKVWAINQGRQYGNRWESEGVPYMFKTTKEDVLEKEFLNEELKNAKNLKPTIEVGDKIGDYSPEAITALEKVIAKADEINKKRTGSQEEIQNTVAELQAIQKGISGYRRAGHSALNLNEPWVASSASVGITHKDGVTRLDSYGAGWAYIDKPQPGYLIQHFKLKVNYNGYSMLSLKQSNPNYISYEKTLNNYVIVLKADQIEFQKYNPGAATTGVITKYPNEYIKEGEWVDVEFGCVDVPGGVNVIFKVNGKEVINEVDTETPNFGDGYFVAFPGSKEGAAFELKAADPATIPTEEFVFEGGASQMDDAKTLYNADNKIAVKTGTFTEVDVTTADGSKAKVSTDANAQVVYTVTDQEVAYKTYYYHTPVEGGDPNATISMVAYSPTTGGKTEVIKNVDFSKGETGWVYLGTYECASHSKIGDIIFTVKGSGQGKLVAPVIGVTKTDKELLEFNRNFYDYSDNLLLMKIDSQKAFTVIDELQIPDAAPYIENNITMVPLRFVSEAFGAQVDWNAETQTATITSGANVVAFTLGNKNYTANGVVKESLTEAKLVNGRTMIPLRATVEALGKKVMWYGNAKLIFIADSFGFAESDATKLESAAKGFERGFN